MATVPMTERRSWLPWTRDSEFQQHLRDDAEVHKAASAKSDEILAGIDAANLSITALSTKLGPLMPITADLDQIVGQRRFRHQMYALSARTGHAVKKIIGWGGGTIVGLATLAAVYQPANDLLSWLLAKITFGTIAARLPAISSLPPVPPVPGVTH